MNTWGVCLAIVRREKSVTSYAVGEKTRQTGPNCCPLSRLLHPPRRGPASSNAFLTLLNAKQMLRCPAFFITWKPQSEFSCRRTKSVCQKPVLHGSQTRPSQLSIFKAPFLLSPLTKIPIILRSSGRSKSQRSGRPGRLAHQPWSIALTFSALVLNATMDFTKKTDFEVQ